MIYRLMAVLATLLLLACQGPAPETGEPRLPLAVPAPIVDLDAITLPPELDGLVLTGSAMTERAEARMFFYQHTDNGDTARVVVYAFPGGWEDMPPLQAIGGHYGQAREQELARLQRRGYGTIEGRNEGLFASDELAYPVAEVLLVPEDQRAHPAVVLMVAASRPAFVRLVRETRYPQPEQAMVESRDHIARLVNAIAESLEQP